jgi:hypothetical protein
MYMEILKWREKKNGADINFGEIAEKEGGEA